MAKHRPQPKSKLSAVTRPDQRTAEAHSRQSSAPTAHSQPPSSPARRSTYFEAVALYEQGLAALQRHEYGEAVRVLESVLRLYPEEKELHERVTLYVNICKRHATPQETAPKTLDERLYAATLAINGGRYDEALSHLHLVRDEDPDNDHALYMLAVAHAQRGEHAAAIAHLERAIALNPENRALARRDPDLEPVSDDEAFQAALDSVPRTATPRPSERRRPARSRSAR